MTEPKKKQSNVAHFVVGAKVRVKAGTIDPDFEDIPIGGWAGVVRDIEEKAKPPNYLIRWNRHTLDNMHPVFRNRSERDALELEVMWLGEDVLEPDTGEAVVVEQPTTVRSRPLDPKDDEDRIRVVFGLTSDEPLPEVNDKSLTRYHAFLSERVSFPFDATFSQESEPFSTRKQAVSVIGLRSTDEIDDMYGLMCEARMERKVVQLPLAEVEPKKGNPNRQPVKDYSFWFVNWS